MTAAGPARRSWSAQRWPDSWPSAQCSPAQWSPAQWSPAQWSPTLWQLAASWPARRQLALSPPAQRPLTLWWPDDPEQVDAARQAVGKAAAGLTAPAAALRRAESTVADYWSSADGSAAAASVGHLAARVQASQSALRVASQALEQYRRCLVRALDDVAARHWGEAADDQPGEPVGNGMRALAPAGSAWALPTGVAGESIYVELVSSALATAAALHAAAPNLSQPVLPVERGR